MDVGVLSEFYHTPPTVFLWMDIADYLVNVEFFNRYLDLKKKQQAGQIPVSQTETYFKNLQIEHDKMMGDN